MAQQGPAEPLRQRRGRQRIAVHFGANEPGRGLIATFFHECGYRIIFVERRSEVVKKLTRNRTYEVAEVHGNTLRISNYKALCFNTDRAEIESYIKEADIVTSTVGPGGLKGIAPYIANGIQGRTKQKALAVIACEEERCATDQLRVYIEACWQQPVRSSLQGKAAYADCVLDRIVASDKSEDSNLKVEKTRDWIVHDAPLQTLHSVLKLRTVKFATILDDWYRKKWYTIETGKIITAFWGHYMGIPTLCQAIANRTILKNVRQALRESVQVLMPETNPGAAEQSSQVEQVIKRLESSVCNAECIRIGKSPMKKLREDDVLIEPAAWLLSRGQNIDGLLKGIEMALRFQDVAGDEESKELGSMMRNKPAQHVAEVATGLVATDALYPCIVKIVKRIQGPCATCKRHVRSLCSCCCMSRQNAQGSPEARRAPGSSGSWRIQPQGRSSSHGSLAPGLSRDSSRSSSSPRRDQRRAATSSSSSGTGPAVSVSSHRTRTRECSTDSGRHGSTPDSHGDKWDEVHRALPREGSKSGSDPSGSLEVVLNTLIAGESTVSVPRR